MPNTPVTDGITFKLENKVPEGLEETISAIKKRSGIDIVFGNRYVDGKLDAKFRGLFDGEKIIISPNATKADVFNAVVLHELTHGIEGTSIYKDIYDFVIKEKYGADTARLDADTRAKITVEEYFENSNFNRRFYNLQDIKISPAAVDFNLKKYPNQMAFTDDNLSVSDLFDIVKKNDSGFHPKESSLILNEDGTPMVVYHGTDAKFDVFDMSKGRANMDIQGSFFSPWELDAQGYGENVGAYYLSIKNPADGPTAYAALNRFKGQDNAGVKAKEYLIEQGYDGVNFYDEEYVAFYPTQIKSATDNIGTFDGSNPDIRYSFATEQSPETGKITDESENGHMNMTDDEFGKLLNKRTRTRKENEGIKSTGVEGDVLHTVNAEYPHMYDINKVEKGFVDSVNSEIEQAVENIRSGNVEKVPDNIEVTKLSDKTKSDLGRIADFDISDYSCKIEKDTLFHIEDRHGLKGKHDSSLSDPQDVARMGYIINNYDNVVRAKDENGKDVYSRKYNDKNNRPSPVLMMTKKIDGTYCISYVVPDSKKKTLWITSARIQKADVGSQVPNGNTPQLTSETPLVSSSANNNISQNMDTVNNKYMRNDIPTYAE